jgi:glycosyltransferase involved in cell wall biosynthesis
MTQPILLDVTSLVAAPHRSGIQRVQREVIRHWPVSSELILVALDPSGLMRRLPDAVGKLLAPARDQVGATFESDRAALQQLVLRSDWLSDSKLRHVLNLELFYDPWRADAYRRMCQSGWRIQWLVYDFMPWLHPELFPPGIVASCMPYLRALRDVPDIAFISQQTGEQYAHRVMRGQGRSGRVLPLGADGIGLERQTWSPSRTDVVAIGTLERRKNTHVLISAFRSLWASGVKARLVLAGRIDPTFRATLGECAADIAAGRLVVLDHPDDAAIRDALRSARVLVSPSAVEGFGLTPLEALNSGIPTITSDTLPSLGVLPRQGQIRLREITTKALADAIKSVLRDDMAAKLWAEASSLQLPTWQSFTHAVANWTEGPAQ